MSSNLKVQSSKFTLLLVLGLWSVDCGVRTAPAQPTNEPGRPDYSAFKLITDRNIFNQRRYASQARRPRRETRNSARGDYFALAGTMSYEKGTFAFFEGTSSEYKKVLKPAETIAGYTVTAITPAYVKLASSSNEIELPVGMQLRREESGDWHLSERAELPAVGAERTTFTRQAPGLASTPASLLAVATNGEPEEPPDDPDPQSAITDSQSGTAGTNATAAAASGGDSGTDPVLKRLMDKAAAERGQPR